MQQNMQKIILTPVNLENPKTDNGEKARKDYLRERSKFKIGDAKWDDAYLNEARKGDMFAFVNLIADKMEIFQVLKVIPAEYRPEYWDIQEHKNRNVLYLSPLKRTIKFSTYKYKYNYSPDYSLKGTFYGRWDQRI